MRTIAAGALAIICHPLAWIWKELPQTAGAKPPSAVLINTVSSGGRASFIWGE
jgi:hypothetical protein